MRSDQAMVAAGLGQPGDFTAALEPATEGTLTAIRIWNRMGGEVRWPDLAYLIALEEVDDFELMVDRVYTIRDLMKDNHGGS